MTCGVLSWASTGRRSTTGETPLQIVWRYPCGRVYFDATTQRFIGAER